MLVNVGVVLDQLSGFGRGGQDVGVEMSGW